MADLPARVLSPSELGIDLDVEEDGLSPEANARTKANAYCRASSMPAFAIDAGLEIDKFPPEKQPGVFVRRVHEHRGYVPDQELIDHYVKALMAVGGESSGRWQVAIALATPDGLVEHRLYAIEALFTATPSTVRIDGAPISSLMMDRGEPDLLFGDDVRRSPGFDFVETILAGSVHDICDTIGCNDAHATRPNASWRSDESSVISDLRGNHDPADTQRNGGVFT